MNHILIIGAGGVASYFLPVMLKTFRPAKVTIVDKDILEKRNLDRQMFGFHQVGQNKARALLNLQANIPETAPTDDTWVAIDDWFHADLPVPDDIDVVVCVADNHQARRDAITFAERRQVPCFIGGNEYIDSEALVVPAGMDRGNPRHPFVKYPEIMTSMEGSPFACTGDAQEASPQLAVANMTCAALLLRLMWLWLEWFPKQKMGAKDRERMVSVSLPVEMSASLSGFNTR